MTDAVTIRSESVGTDVRLSVVDNGPGIRPGRPEARVRCVLEHQARRHGHRARDLPVDRRCASWPHHGSQQCGRRSDVLRQLAVEASHMKQTVVKPSVFLVDDDPSVLKALSRVLREEGWSVETFESAEAFLAQRDHETRGLPRARRDDAGARRTRVATPARRGRRVVADRLRHGAWRHSDVGAGDQGGRNGFPDQAGAGRRCW